MRIKLLTLMMLTLSVLSANAQKPVFGLSMGCNYSNLIGPDKIEESKPRIGICPGINVDIPLAYDVYLEIGAYYSQQGVRVVTDEFIRGTTREHYKITKYVDYLHIPLYWKQSFGDIYTKLGPFASIVIKAQSDWKQEIVYRDSLTTDEGSYGSFINNLRNYDVGAAFGIGYQTSISRGLDIFFDASYKIGFFSVENKTETSKRIIRNQFFTFSCGVYFADKRRSKNYRRH